ncbi:MAG: methylmalonyl-CoA carboxyltransferase, partial [Anaerolineales bacterium]|nr:methylmalonyl-CoA carboxyltransferase [Anaerolineales bacterium]
EGAVNVLYRKQLQRLEDPQAEQERLVAEYRQKFATPYVPAAHGYVDDIVVPAETRPRLIAALELLRNKRVSSPAKKHGIMPV